jgi:hypothetical protein
MGKVLWCFLLLILSPHPEMGKFFGVIDMKGCIDVFMVDLEGFGREMFEFKIERVLKLTAKIAILIHKHQ